jgi:predicted nuclease of restriction endonuclease-like (RecB) superfamily
VIKGRILKKSVLFVRIKELLDEARAHVARNVNSTMTFTYFHIGRMIIEDEQHGKRRATYAEQTLKNLSQKLVAEYGKGFTVRNLEFMRKFYLTYQSRISKSVVSKSNIMVKATISKSVISKSPPQDDSSDIKAFPLSWTHYLLLMRIENPEERSFYEIEALQQTWSVRELQRQFDASLYERLVLSNDPKKARHFARKGHTIAKPADLFKEPYVLEFLGLKEEHGYSESELESAIIDKIEHFLLELGKGFLFAGRQVRFTFDHRHFRVDLVLYNRILKAFVVIDLKIGDLTHQDLGQMQMYVNYYDRYVKNRDENKTIGIILCKDRNESLVEISLPKNQNQIFARKYQMYLPSKEELRKQLEYFA